MSDNANRFMYFEHASPMAGSDGGILLASYSWSDDALKWDAYADDERYLRALAGAQAVFGRRIEVFHTGKGKTQSWIRDHYAYGEASVLFPGQHTELFPDIPTSEGPLHFAGDHTSIKPAWIEGAPRIRRPHRVARPHGLTGTAPRPPSGRRASSGGH
ncbi:FAD-dependent oxidoreductase [Yinghuangia aomiensis]